jgi:hypothetical protein
MSTDRSRRARSAWDCETIRLVSARRAALRQFGFARYRPPVADVPAVAVKICDYGSIQGSSVPQGTVELDHKASGEDTMPFSAPDQHVLRFIVYTIFRKPGDGFGYMVPPIFCSVGEI